MKTLYGLKLFFVEKNQNYYSENIDSALRESILLNNSF